MQHIGGSVARGVKNPKPRSQQYRFPSDVTAPVNFGFEIDIGEEGIDVGARPKVHESPGNIAGRQNPMAPVQNHGFSHFSYENIVFDD